MGPTSAIDTVYIRSVPGSHPHIAESAHVVAEGEAGHRTHLPVSTLLEESGRVLLYGDSQDDAAEGRPYLGQAARISLGDDGAVVLQSSLTGFPPLYLYDGPGPLVLSSGILDIVRTPGVTLSLDQRGVAEWAAIGKPINHRTLFRHVSVVPAGETFRIGSSGTCERVHAWSPPSHGRFADYTEYLEAQGEALRAAVRRTDTSGSFLSLTAGLDTRAILACLASEGRTVDAVTLSGPGDSLDARRARALARALGFEHRILHQDQAFFGNLEVLTQDAIRLSGGMSGLDGAFEVHMYRSLAPKGRARVSGNLGNQIGRSGTEGVGVRGMSDEWFGAQTRAAMSALPSTHWHEQIAAIGGRMGPRELIQLESLFASLANASIGAALGLQQAPYADRTMIENKCAEPLNIGLSRGSNSVRARDLRHRFLGEPSARSFQRRVVMQVGGPVASIPINWGWRPSGGVSVTAAALGVAAGADALFSRRRHFRRVALPISRMVGVHGLNGFGGESMWENRLCRELVLDHLRDACSTEHPLLDRWALSRLIDRFDEDGTAAEVAVDLLTLVLTCRTFGISE